jgi:hypothetical protein
MEPQTVTIEVAPQVAQIIRALEQKAAAQGVSLDSLLLHLIPSEESGARPFYETATPEEWVAAFTNWAESHGPNTPGLTREDVSRERMYEDD